MAEFLVQVKPSFKIFCFNYLVLCTELCPWDGMVLAAFVMVIVILWCSSLRAEGWTGLVSLDTK
jgi:hypothetical protein